MTKWFALLLVAAVLPGCGSSGNGPVREAVHGRVTLDGQDVAQGSIVFTPSGGNKGMVTGGTIKDGRYELSAKNGPVVGTNRVEIRSVKKTGRKVPAPMGNPGDMADESVEGIPPQYNSRSTLEVDVESGGDNEHNFELKSR
ncbi:MAG: hypothetical protein U9N87_15160 [Planctomycetota bacterium]|nr:hypothetical protein [Planctomycetota bacterium]